MTISAFADVAIETKAEGKGRSFTATALAYVRADRLWEGGKSDTGDVVRPVWAAFLGSDDELRPFVANLVQGRRAVLPRADYSRRAAEGFEFLRSVGYRFTWQRCPEGSIATAYLPELFLLDPGMVDPEGARFVVLPPRAWAEGQVIPERDAIVAHARRLALVRRLNERPKNEWEIPKGGFVEPFSAERLTTMVPTAYLFSAYLDRRTRAPILADGRFYLQLMLACLRDGLAQWSTARHASHYGEAQKFGHEGGLGFLEVGTKRAGLLSGVALKASHDRIEELLAAEVDEFFRLTDGGAA